MPRVAKHQVEERKKYAEEGLYYCKECKGYLPDQFFTPLKGGAFEKRSKCKMCYSDTCRKGSNSKFGIRIPKDIYYHIKYLMLYKNASIEDILTYLILEGLGHPEIKQKLQKYQ